MFLSFINFTRLHTSYAGNLSTREFFVCAVCKKNVHVKVICMIPVFGRTCFSSNSFFLARTEEKVLENNDGPV